MLDDERIEKAKQYCSKTTEGVHEHNDCIRIAYEWLDAQDTRATLSGKGYPLKHLIERWGGRYVSTDDVIVAAHMHPRVEGAYPEFSISLRLTEPSIKRIEGIGEAFSQGQRESHSPDEYKKHED